MISLPEQQADKTVKGSLIILSALFFLIGVALFNWWANPYYLTGVEEGEKPTFFFHLGMVKPYHYHAQDIRAVIIGSSRAGSGLDPAAPALAGENYYNLAIPGARIRQIDRALRSAVITGGAEKLIVSLDLFGFNSHGDLEAGFAEAYRRRMTVSPRPWLDHEFMLQSLRDHASSLMSYQALYDSVKTIHPQSASGGTVFTLHDNGLWTPTFRESRKPLRAFINSENSYLDNNWFPSNDRFFSLQPHKGLDPIQVYVDMLDFAYSNNVSVQFVLLPVHARMLEAISYAGLWDVFEQWKVLLVQKNEEVAALYQAEPYLLWDFLTYSELSMEPVTQASRSSDLLWMYDSSHVSSAGGSVILRAIAEGVGGDLGQKLSGDMLQDWLQDVRIRQKQFRQQWSSETVEIRQRVEARQKKHNWNVELRH